MRVKHLHRSFLLRFWVVALHEMGKSRARYVSAVLLFVFALWQAHNLLPHHHHAQPDDFEHHHEQSDHHHPHHQHSDHQPVPAQEDSNTAFDLFHHASHEGAVQLFHPVEVAHWVKKVNPSLPFIVTPAFRFVYPKIPPERRHPPKKAFVRATYLSLSSLTHRGPPTFAR